MPGVFDRLQSQLDEKAKEGGGISAGDIAKLAPPLRRIMRLMLVELELSLPDMLKAIEGLPEAQRLSQTELDEALATLTREGWLIQMGEEKITYRVNLAGKRGSDTTAGIWANLNIKIKTPPKTSDSAS